jgi:putative photosynthetic complex assembly protein 2
MILAAIAAAVLYTVFLWWFSTGAILWLDRRPRATFRWSLIAASGLAGLALLGLATSMRDASPTGAVIAFTSALGLWGWHEMTFLMGVIAGPRRTDCPSDAIGWRRFALATSTLIYHEVALVVTAAIIVAVTWMQPNQIGCWTFLILLVCRLSAKLNLFFGVPNFSEEFFPDHLRYMTSYLRKRPMNGLFPVSIFLGLGLAITLGAHALSPAASRFQVIGFSLIFALAALALIEHIFMVVPLPDAALWRWAIRTPAKGETPS